MRLPSGTKRRDKVENRENYPAVSWRYFTKYNLALLDLGTTSFSFRGGDGFLDFKIVSWISIVFDCICVLSKLAIIIFIEFMVNLARSWNKSKRNYKVSKLLLWSKFRRLRVQVFFDSWKINSYKFRFLFMIISSDENRIIYLRTKD